MLLLNPFAHSTLCYHRCMALIFDTPACCDYVTMSSHSILLPGPLPSLHRAPSQKVEKMHHHPSSTSPSLGRDGRLPLRTPLAMGRHTRLAAVLPQAMPVNRHNHCNHLHSLIPALATAMAMATTQPAADPKRQDTSEHRLSRIPFFTGLPPPVPPRVFATPASAWG
jgi:hypothetical protein